MSHKKIVIIGAGGLGREILDVINACNRHGDGIYEPLGFIFDVQYGMPGTLVLAKVLYTVILFKVGLL